MHDPAFSISDKTCLFAHPGTTMKPTVNTGHAMLKGGETMPSYTSLKKIKDPAERDRTVNKLLALRAQLDRDIPTKTANETLLLATWNIREFGDNRSDESLHYLAEVISRFDLVAIQEVSSDMTGLQKLMALLGHNWDYLVTDSTDGPAGGGQRMAFLFDRCKVFFRNLAGELILPPSSLIDKQLQFARAPYIVAFQAGWFRLILTTVHIYYGTDTSETGRRVQEIDAVASLLNKRAKNDNENYILLGDFNISQTTDVTMQQLDKNGYYIPDAIRQHPSDLAKTKHYDQIAFKLKIDKDMTVFSEGDQHAGAFDFTQTIYPLEDLPIYRPLFDEKNTKGKTDKQIETYYLTKWRTFQMSDHLPLWIELKVDFSNQYLQKIPKS